MAEHESVGTMVAVSVCLVAAVLVYGVLIGNLLVSVLATGVVLAAWCVYLFARLVFAVERIADRR